MSDRAGKQRAASMEFVETILRDAQKQGQSRLRSFLASLGTVPVFGLGLGFSPAPQSRLRSFLASLGTVPVFGLGLGFSPAPQSRLRSCLASLGTVPVFGSALGFSPAQLMRDTSGTLDGVSIVHAPMERIPKE